VASLAREYGHPEATCDALITSLAGRCEDDITVILARIPSDRRTAGPDWRPTGMYLQREFGLWSSRKRMPRRLESS
jgi:hypothetical protein